MIPRSSGIFLHITSLPNAYGCGTMGQSAYDFVDFLHRSGQRYWQILPLGPTDAFGSPYSSPSAFAGNMLLIDPDLLVKDGLLTSGEVDMLKIQAPDKVNLAETAKIFIFLLKKAYYRAAPLESDEYVEFLLEHEAWLEDYALYMALVDHFYGQPAAQWEDLAIRHRDIDAMRLYQDLLADEIDFYRFGQYLFFKQWTALKKYANDQGVYFIGDLPFYLSPGSAEIWTDPTLFSVDENLQTTKCAGVPPDAFSATGQMWGNPTYNWENHAFDNYAWWKRRIAHCAKLYDVLRIDHFRAIHSYWEIPAGQETAATGRWIPGPGKPFLNAISAAAPGLELIAEDLGDLTPEVRRFVRDSGIPGMRILVQAFDGDTQNLFLPHNCRRDVVYYSSTHDTPTFMQWYNDLANDEKRAFAGDYIHLDWNEGFNWSAIRCAMGTVCRLCIIPMQDVLGLGADARMNTPSTTENNWAWRMRADAMNTDVSSRLAKLAGLYGRK